MSLLKRLSATLLIASLGLNFYLFRKNQQLNAVLTATQPQKTTVSDTASDLLDSVPNHHQPKVPLADIEYINTDQLAAQAQQAFKLQQFADAIYWYNELNMRSTIAANLVKQDWLEQLRQWITTSQWWLVNQFTSQFLSDFTQDSQIISIYAESLVAQQKLKTAIEQYELLVDLNLTTQHEQYYIDLLRQHAIEYIAQLSTAKAWTELFNFTEQRLHQDPQYPPFILAQASALIELGQLADAQHLLEPLLTDDYYHQQALDLLKALERARLTSTGIELKTLGEHYIVNARINDTNELQLMIDTGASISVLTRQMFEAIEPWTTPIFEQDILLNTAGGVVNAPIYRFERFQIAEFAIDNPHFVIIDLENNDDYHGLLGMSFLKHFKFEIDQQANLLILSPK